MVSGAKARLTVIDTDPGIDAAIGILLALVSPEFAIAGVTTVAGNIGLDTTTRNASSLLTFVGRDDIPVFRGAAGPLSPPGPDPLDIHGGDGLGGISLPEPSRTRRSQPAMAWLADLLLDQLEGSVDVLALGSLTNLAHLFLNRLEAAKRIGRMIAMGGAILEPGNAGPHSEYNLASDPEAAATILGSGLPLVLIPLDVTHRVCAMRDFAASLKASGKPAAVMIARLIEGYFDSSTARESRPLHDPCVMLFALAPELFRIEALRLSVSTAVGEEAGALVVGEEGSAVQVPMGVDAPAVLDLLKKRVTAV
jgi:inosine-uridine nucleoside N-ribohydrolase